MSKIIVDQIQAAGGMTITLPKAGAVGQILKLTAGDILQFADMNEPVVSYSENPAKTSNLTVGKLWVNKFTGEIFVCVDATTNFNRWIGSAGTGINIPQGQQLFETVGAQSLMVPAGVYKLSAVLVGAGAGGHSNWANPAGNGGALAYANDIPVTPGETLSLTIGAGGLRGANGGATILSRGSTVLFTAQGGLYSSTIRAMPVSGAVTCKGGQGGLGSTSSSGGGGGAGGYSGNGGDGSYGPVGSSSPNGGNGSGGGGAGGFGYQSSTYGFGGGGGVGLYGEGASGVNSHGTSLSEGNNFSYTYSSGSGYGGKGGSGGEQGSPNSNTSQTFNGRTTYNGEGGKFGGGGAGSGTSVTDNTNFCKGGQGGARIIWGAGRAFPATNTADVTTIA